MPLDAVTVGDRWRHGCFQIAGHPECICWMSVKNSVPCSFPFRTQGFTPQGKVLADSSQLLLWGKPTCLSHAPSWDSWHQWRVDLGLWRPSSFPEIPTTQKSYPRLRARYGISWRPALWPNLHPILPHTGAVAGSAPQQTSHKLISQSASRGTQQLH